MKRKTRKTRNDLITTKRYAGALKYAKAIVLPILESDAGYTTHASNILALESMITGWITAQPYFAPWLKANQTAHPRDMFGILLNDFASQVASDAAAKAHFANVTTIGH